MVSYYRQMCVCGMLQWVTFAQLSRRVTESLSKRSSNSRVFEGFLLRSPVSNHYFGHLLGALGTLGSVLAGGPLDSAHKEKSVRGVTSVNISEWPGVWAKCSSSFSYCKLFESVCFLVRALRWSYLSGTSQKAEEFY